jgi:hypothetical protein
MAYPDNSANEPKTGETEKLCDALKPLQPLIGKTWRGALKGSTPEKPIESIAQWERALNGNAVRILHSVNNGEYGGETIILWDPQKKSLVYFYFTTAGFFSQGAMTFENGKFISHETITGSQEGITEVNAITEILPDGRMHSKSQYFKKGQWEDGHEVIYVEDPTAKVIFK